MAVLESIDFSHVHQRKRFSYLSISVEKTSVLWTVPEEIVGYPVTLGAWKPPM